MPCGCFGGAGAKKKGSRKGSDVAPPKPPKLVEESPIEQQKQIQQSTSPVYSAPSGIQTESNGVTKNGDLANGGAKTVNGDVPVTPDKPITSQSTVDGSKSTGARSRAELYAKRREFFRPLYDVSLSGSNQRFGTPRAASTLPARGKRGGAYLIGDGTGYFTSDGRFVPTDGGAGDGNEVGDRPEGEILSSDAGSVEDSSLQLSESQFVESSARLSDRPPRPTSQPSAPAGQWDDILDESEREIPQDEFHQKHHQIVQSPHSPSVPLPPPPPKPINPHFVEFQEKHHKILHDPDNHSKDPKVAQRIVEKRLTELDKLHNEVKQHYEKRMVNGPIDVDSLVERYTEDRWKKMVDMWEAEGLIVEGGMVVVDEQGNVVQRELEPSRNSRGFEVTKVQQNIKTIGPDGETIVEHTHVDGDQVVKVVKTEREIQNGNDGVTVVKHTETVMVEKFVDNNPQSTTQITTIITPPTPQPGNIMDDPKLLEYIHSESSFAQDPILEESENIVEFQTEGYVQEENLECEPLIELPSDENLHNIHTVTEKERSSFQEDAASNNSVSCANSAEYRVSPPPSPPQTCTPPPSPKRERNESTDRQPDGCEPPVEGSTTVCGVVTSSESGGAGTATPPPSPPLEATPPTN